MESIVEIRQINVMGKNLTESLQMRAASAKLGVLKTRWKSANGKINGAGTKTHQTLQTRPVLENLAVAKTL